MSFNLKKAQNINNSVVPQSKAILENTEKHKLSLEDKGYVPSYNALLESDRRPHEDGFKTQEARLDEVRKKSSVSEKTTQGALSDSKSKLYPHRQFDDGSDKYSVTPLAMASEAYDRKWRDAFSKANKGADTKFWDEFVGQQLDGEVTKVNRNIPERGSQLQNSPERFSGLENLPINEDAEKNRENFGKKVNVDLMHGFSDKNKALKMAISSLKEADKLLLGVYLKVYSEKRAMSSVEKELVEGINKDKANLLMSLAQVNPMDPVDPVGEVDPVSVDPVMDQTDSIMDPADTSGLDDLQDVDSNISSDPSLDSGSEADFLDGNPTVSGDESYWSNQSGFSADQEIANPDVSDIFDESVAQSLFDDDEDSYDSGLESSDESSLVPESEVSPSSEIPQSDEIQNESTSVGDSQDPTLDGGISNRKDGKDEIDTPF